MKMPGVSQGEISSAVAQGLAGALAGAVGGGTTQGQAPQGNTPLAVPGSWDAMRSGY